MIALKALLTMLLALTGIMPAPMWAWVAGREMEIGPSPVEQKQRFVLSCAEDGKVTEYVAEGLDTHGDILQLWTPNGGVVQLKNPVCVIEIADPSN